MNKKLNNTIEKRKSAVRAKITRARALVLTKEIENKLDATTQTDYDSMYDCLLTKFPIYKNCNIDECARENISP